MLYTAQRLRQALLRRCGGAPVVLPVAVVLHALVVALVDQVVVHQSLAVLPSCLTAGWFWWTVGLMALFTGLLTFLGQLGDITQLNASSLHFSPLSLGCILFLVLWLVAVCLLLYPVRLERKASLWAGAGCVAAVALVYGVAANALIFTPMGVSTDQKLSQATVNRETGVLLGLWRGALNQVHAGGPTGRGAGQPGGGHQDGETAQRHPHPLRILLRRHPPARGHL